MPEENPQGNPPPPDYTPRGNDLPGNVPHAVRRLAERNLAERLHIDPTPLTLSRGVVVTQDPEGNELARPRPIAWFDMSVLSQREATSLMREFRLLDRVPRGLRGPGSSSESQRLTNCLNSSRFAVLDGDGFDVFVKTRIPTERERRKIERKREELEEERRSWGLAP